jgi:type III restriction enzyme
MPLTFFEHPILNSPYAYPGRHWELDADGQPTHRLIESRRRSDLITPMPKAKKRKPRPSTQVELALTAGSSWSASTTSMARKWPARAAC